MFEKTHLRRAREKIAVRIELIGGQVIDGDLFAFRDERLSDLLNDDRAFVPVDLGEDQVEVIAKSQIAHVRPIKEGSAKRVDDPYGILRIERDATDEEVRAAWRKRLKACHPDRLMALNLDADIVIAARNACQRINMAYDQINEARAPTREGAA